MSLKIKNARMKVIRSSDTATVSAGGSPLVTSDAEAVKNICGVG